MSCCLKAWASIISIIRGTGGYLVPGGFDKGSGLSYALADCAGVKRFALAPYCLGLPPGGPRRNTMTHEKVARLIVGTIILVTGMVIGALWALVTAYY